MESVLSRRARRGLAAFIFSASSLVISSCAGTPQEQVTAQVKTQITADLAELTAAARAIQAAAPAPDADGWNATADAAAVENMRVAWRRARVAYERIEGAIAVLFPEYDASTDARFEDFIAAGPDANYFDGTGVTGVHAIERILWSNETPASVRAFEMRVGGAQAPAPGAFPANVTQASEFRTGLVQRLVDDCAAMEAQFRPLALDNAAAFRGVIASMGEQVEKVHLAATAEEESRYARHTLADMRANLEGGRRTFAAFRPLLVSAGRETLATQIEAKFGEISAAYTALSGDALPAVPEGWNPDSPSAAHLATPYGRLHAQLTTEADPARAGSLVNLMNEAARVLMIPELPE